MSKKNEDFLIQRNDDIDNTVYELLDAIMREEDKKVIRSELRNAVEALVQDLQVEHQLTEEDEDEVIDSATEQVKKHGRWSGSHLEWDMFIIGNTFTTIEFTLEENGIPVCHPWFDTDNEEAVCCETSDKCAYCPRKM